MKGTEHAINGNKTMQTCINSSVHTLSTFLKSSCL